jgi:tetratricopeptide (TPR) repeat protein
MGGENSLGSNFEGAFKVMRQAGFAAAMDNFFHELLAQDPTLPFWEQYVQVAADAGTTERMLTTVRQAVAHEDLGEGAKAALHLILFKALLAADNPDEAVKELRGLMAMETSSDTDYSYSTGYYGGLLAQLGVLLKKPEWVDEGIGTAKKWLATAAEKKRSSGNADIVLATLVKVLSEQNHGPEAESLLADALAAATAEQKSSRRYRSQGSAAMPVLAQLAGLYHQAGRHADVLELFLSSADWGVADVSGLFDNSFDDNTVSLMWLHTGSSELPLPYLAAKALLVAGQKEPAQKITDALLERYPGLDRGYELLLELQGTNAIPKLDELFARDQFEERPLIWKAHLLRGQGRLEEAEKFLRQAISIDPSDGEEGRGDRMRVYAELAVVRASRGDQKEADFFREVVKAIRLSEDADQFYAAGLLKRAVGMYQEGLNHFSDAYCIQSRLAIQLSALGMTAEAEEHYRRAFELMPDSFGRVESHCFGCERAFDGERAQGIAEKTFSKLAEERPDKPQIHYLLGYLRFEQERFNEARTNFLAAVRLDPDYLNAWVKLKESSEQVLMPAKERDAITFNILRLDPLGRHASGSFSRVSDLAGLWDAVAIAAARQPVVNTNLFTLTASKLALEKKAKLTADESSENPYLSDYYFTQQYDRHPTPAQAISETPFVRVAGEMLSGAGNPSDW